jgi:hypothetical protein
MCDYSLLNVRSRPAKVGDKLTTRDFGSGTRGFAAARMDISRGLGEVVRESRTTSNLFDMGIRRSLSARFGRYRPCQCRSHS